MVCDGMWLKRFREKWKSGGGWGICKKKRARDYQCPLIVPRVVISITSLKKSLWNGLRIVSLKNLPHDDKNGKLKVFTLERPHSQMLYEIKQYIGLGDDMIGNTPKGWTTNSWVLYRVNSRGLVDLIGIFVSSWKWIFCKNDQKTLFCSLPFPAWVFTWYHFFFSRFSYYSLRTTGVLVQTILIHLFNNYYFQSKATPPFHPAKLCPQLPLIVHSLMGSLMSSWPSSQNQPDFTWSGMCATKPRTRRILAVAKFKHPMSMMMAKHNPRTRMICNSCQKISGASSPSSCPISPRLESCISQALAPILTTRFGCVN